MRLRVLIGGCVAALAVGVLGCPPAWADDCAGSVCTGRVAPGNVARPPLPGSSGGLQTVRGIPCTGAHLGACIALRSSGAG